MIECILMDLLQELLKRIATKKKISQSETFVYSVMGHGHLIFHKFEIIIPQTVKIGRAHV